MSSTRNRAVSLLAAGALGLAPLAVGSLASSAAAAPSRSAETSVDTTYLADTLGVGATTVIETVTYDRFQWLLGQDGQFAFLIGDPSDAGFKTSAQQADAAARAAGVKRIYWFNPNLTGYADSRNLDTRNPARINLAVSSQTVFGNTWKHLLGAYLGNGIKSAATNATTVTIAADETVVNDLANPLFDHRAGATPAAAASDSLFFVYDKSHAVGGDADKIVDWTNLTTTPAEEVTAAVTADLASVSGGGAAIDELSQFDWWKSAANAKHKGSYGDADRYGGDILESSDGADGWRIQQVTYPELLHLLDKKDEGANFAILFGGTWCHNTRAVLKQVNEQAQDNDVKVVYNFDLVLDGGTTNGSNGGTNPIHIRDNSYNSAGTLSNFRPSNLYGDVVRTYLRNVVTEYDPNSGNRVAYYPGGDTTKYPDVVRKLQVPFLVNYQRGTATNPSTTSVKRQWIQQNTDSSTGLATFKEYMSEWWFTKPSVGNLGLATKFTSVANPGFPYELPFPSSADSVAGLADSSFLTREDATRSSTDQTDIVAARRSLITTALRNRDFGLEAVARLKGFFGGLPGGVVSDQVVKAAAIKIGQTAAVTVSIANDFGRIPSGTVTLAVAGKSFTAQIANAAASFTVAGLPVGTHPYTVTFAGDSQVKGFTKSGTISVAKTAVTKTALKVTTAPTSTKAGKLTATITTPAGLAKASGAVTVTLTKGATKKTAKASLKNGVATIALPKLAKGTWTVAAAYAGDATYTAAKATGSTLVIKK